MSIATQESNAVETRQNVFGHALMFIAGFTFIFVALGATAGLLFGTFFQAEFVDLLVAIGGALLFVLGIHMSGLLKWLATQLEGVPSMHKPLIWIDRKMDEIILPERRFQAGYGQSPGYIRSGVVGMTFAAGWTPCIGPLLGSILSIGLNATRAEAPWLVASETAVLLFAYSMGLAIPFLLAAWVLSRASGVMRKLNRYVGIIEKISAVLLIAIGLLLMFGTLSALNSYFNLEVQPEWVYNLEASLSTGGVGIPLAMLAGLLSFLSPCVLPLIPVYLSYLTGIAATSQQAA